MKRSRGLAVRDRVMVLNTTMGGKLVEEGLARIVELGELDGEGEYQSASATVEFDAEPGVEYPRWVEARNVRREEPAPCSRD